MSSTSIHIPLLSPLTLASSSSYYFSSDSNSSRGDSKTAAASTSTSTVAKQIISAIKQRSQPQPQQPQQHQYQHKRDKYYSLSTAAVTTTKDTIFFNQSNSIKIGKECLRLLKSQADQGVLTYSLRPISCKQDFENGEYYGDRYLEHLLTQIIRKTIPNSDFTPGMGTNITSEAAKNATLAKMFDHFGIIHVMDATQLAAGGPIKRKADVVECIISQLFDARSNQSVLINEEGGRCDTKINSIPPPPPSSSSTIEVGKVHHKKLTSSPPSSSSSSTSFSLLTVSQVVLEVTENKEKQLNFISSSNNQVKWHDNVDVVNKLMTPYSISSTIV
ncbi:hypothetical protein DFA_09629 [Cavenderia fasciculata]|uniref:Uncharacterized protein n=1 Tax=Cavenderia fasciculata TaxID=261658 RepID=F4Q858_CACFS|nr:uncharacterized protein DFA_09629 [Cavenderia fasciculata]EGG15958.1 hypothetical protein DFA_09629 [Cavenderia fasciculata]|eukprot:XP_004352283.1 hypothetical protein DFA_09629 [Cavenderia fasciculata]